MNNKNKAKPRSLKPSIKRLIFTRAITERNLPREYLANSIIKEIEELGELPPTLETTKRYISKARNTDNPIDKPWSIGACRDYPNYFPPGSISLLLGYLKNEDSEDEFAFALPGYNRFSIRQAIWIVRLEPVIKEFIPSNNDDYTLEVLSETYASAELASEVMGEIRFDSTELDGYLLNGDLCHILQYDPKAKDKIAIIGNSKPIEQKENNTDEG